MQRVTVAVAPMPKRSGGLDSRYDKVLGHPTMAIPTQYSKVLFEQIIEVLRSAGRPSKAKEIASQLQGIQGFDRIGK